MAKSGQRESSADQMSFFPEPVLKQVEPVIKGRKTTELGPKGKLEHRYPDGSKTTPEDRKEIRGHMTVTAAAVVEGRWDLKEK